MTLIINLITRYSVGLIKRNKHKNGFPNALVRVVVVVFVVILLLPTSDSEKLSNTI